jgi:soluble lytic murein transglycosylase-like protein
MTPRRRPSPRAALAVLAAVAALVAVALVARGRGGEQGPAGLFPGAAVTDARLDRLAYHDDRRAEFESRAAAGLSHVLYAKSPGGATASARRTARFRSLVERAATRHGVDAETLEAIVLLESAGRPDARASDDLEGAVGLTQILAETGRNLLGLRVDVRAAEKLTRRIARGRRVRAREAERRRVDERFDPAKALDATARYLVFARRRLGRDDLAVAAYHMGVGNLQSVLAAYGESEIPYAQVFFDSSPLRHAQAWRRLSALGDDSSTYLWRVGAAREIMRLLRRDPAELARRETLQLRKNSAEELLHPPDATEPFGDPAAVGRARADGALAALRPAQLRAHGLRIDPRMGELAGRLRQSRRLYRALRPGALSVLLAIGAGVRAISATAPLTVTSTVRDERYQRVLARRNVEATDAYSLHTTGWAFDVARTYVDRRQALAFQFMLDRLTALDLIAWVREPGAIHVTAAPDAGTVLGGP